MKYTALPTWALMRVFWKPMSKRHQWQVMTGGRPFTLAEWARGRTQYTIGMDIICWGYILTTAAFLLTK